MSARNNGMDRRTFLLGVLGGALASRGGVDQAFAGNTTAPRVLVTADAAAHVALVDPVAGRVLRRIATLAQPRSIEAIGGARALVAHTELGRCAIVDASTGTARLVRGTFGEPRYTAVHPNGRYAYITDSGREEVAVLDLFSRRLVWRAPVAGPARHLTLTPDARGLWAVLGNVDPRVAILSLADPVRPRVVGVLRMPFAAHDVVAAPGGRRMWVSSGDRRRIAIVDRSGRVMRQLGADASPQHIAFAPDGTAYVTSGDDGTVRVHAPDGRQLARRRIPVGSFNVVERDGLVVSPSLSRGTLAILDGAGRSRRTLAVTSSAHDACIVRA